MAYIVYKVERAGSGWGVSRDGDLLFESRSWTDAHTDAVTRASNDLIAGLAATVEDPEEDRSSLNRELHCRARPGA